MTESPLTTEGPSPPPGLPRWFELLVAVKLLFWLSPLLLVVAVAVGLTSRGPVLFRQRRVGRGGEPFELLKFRTMTHGAAGGSITAPHDRRITSVGRLLRATKLDELPQLVNVLRGEMALVGPRPEVPEFVDRSDPVWVEVLAARPGVTDPVSIRLRDESRWLEAIGGEPERAYRETLLPWKLEGYRAYLERRSAWRDLGILWQTLWAVLLAAGEDPNLPTDLERSTAPESPDVDP